MVIVPKEYHLENLDHSVNSQNEDTSSDTSSASADDQPNESTSIAPRVNNGFSIAEMDYNKIEKFIPANSHINVEHSNDVVIGSLTQFHGPVTIVQNGNSKRILGLGNGGYITEGDGKCDDTLNISSASDLPISSSAQPNSSNATQSITLTTLPQYNPIDQFWTSKRRCLVILAAISFPLIIVALSTTLTLHSTATTPSPLIEEDVTMKPLGKHLQITRGQWGGRPILNNTIPLQHPVPFVIISHTAGVWCKNYRTCSDTLQILQSQHVSSGSPDVGYNFLIGGDANIYVARGWDIRNFHGDKIIGISFIGNFVFDSLTPGMIEACQDLLEEGVKEGKLAANYTLIGHNQTYPTLSPGDKVVAVIKTWSHFKYGDFLQF